MSIIVTGAASGIGQAVSSRLKKAGYSVIATDISKASEVIEHDVTSEESWKKVIQDIKDCRGLVNCAGIRTKAPLAKTSRQNFRQMLEVNVLGAFLGLREVTRAMLRSSSEGTIVNIGSVVAEMSPANQIAYNTSKGALHSLTRSAATELGPHGIRVNAVAPGSIITPLTSAVCEDPERASYLRKRIPAQRGGVPSEIAEVVLFLMSNAASYVNGAVWPVDGGWTIAAP